MANLTTFSLMGFLADEELEPLVEQMNKFLASMDISERFVIKAEGETEITIFYYSSRVVKREVIEGLLKLFRNFDGFDSNENTLLVYDEGSNSDLNGWYKNTDYGEVYLTDKVRPAKKEELSPVPDGFVRATFSKE